MLRSHARRLSAAWVMAPNRTGTIGDRHPRARLMAPRPPHGRSGQQEKGDDGQHCQGRTTSLTVISTSSWCIVLTPLVRLSPRPWLTASTLQHIAGGVVPADPPTGAPPVGQSTVAHPPVFGGSLGRVPEAVHATCPRQHTTPLAPNVWLWQGGRGSRRRAKVPRPKVG